MLQQFINCKHTNKHTHNCSTTQRLLVDMSLKMQYALACASRPRGHDVTLRSIVFARSLLRFTWHSPLAAELGDHSSSSSSSSSCYSSSSSSSSECAAVSLFARSFDSRGNRQTKLPSKQRTAAVDRATIDCSCCCTNNDKLHSRRQHF